MKHFICIDTASPIEDDQAETVDTIMNACKLLFQGATFSEAFVQIETNQPQEAIGHDFEK